MRCCSYNLGLIVRVMFGNFAKLESPRRLVQFWQNFQTSLVLLIPNCTRHRMITYTNHTRMILALIVLLFVLLPLLTGWEWEISRFLNFCKGINPAYNIKPLGKQYQAQKQATD